MTVTNSIENRVRTVSFDVVADTGPFQLDFPVYEATSLSALKSDLVVKLNGVRITAYSIAATFVDGVATDAELTLDEAATGNLEVYSRRAPRSAWSFIDGAKTKAARWTTTFNSLTASVRDVFDETDRQASIIDGLQSGIAERLVVGSVEALRTTPEDYDGTVVEVLGWHAGTLVGGGLFALDADDTTSPDDWGTVIVDEQGRRWKRLHANRLTEADFGVIADGSTDDSDYAEKALQWLTACPAHERRTLWADAGARVITRALTLNTVENHARAQWLAAAGQSATYSVETADDAIVIEIDGGRAIVVIDGPSPIPGMEGCGSLLVARNIGGGAGVPDTGLFIKNIDATPKNQQTSTFYSLKPFDFTGTKRAHIRKVDCRPGKLAPVTYGDCIMDVSNCYAFDIDECTLGGYFDFGIKAAHTENVEGGRIGENVRITNCKWGFSWESETPQPGLNISKMHVNSSTYGNIKLDGVTNYTIDGPLLYSNETRKYTWVKPANQSIVGITQANPAVVNYAGADSYTNGDTIYITGVVGMTEVNSLGFTIANVNTAANTFELQGVNSSGYGAYVSGGTIAATTLTVTCDSGNTPHRLTSPFRVRASFNVADVDDPELDLDNDGESDAPPSGTYTATVLTDYTFTISDDGFAALADTGTFKMRWSDSDFDDIVIRNAVNGVVKNVRFGGQSSRNRRHAVLDTTGSVAGSPTLQGNHVIDNLMTARSNLAPIYVGASKDTVVRHAANWAEDLGRVNYPDDVDPVQRAATGVERLLIVDAAAGFDESSDGGLVSLVRNGKFARGSKFWDAGAGWTFDTDTDDALTHRAMAVYTATDTSTKNLMMRVPMECEEGVPITICPVYQVTAGTLTTFRARAVFYDAAGAAIGSPLTGEDVLTVPAAWARLRQRIMPPTGARTVAIGWQVSTSADAVIQMDRITSTQALPDYPMTDIRAYGVVGDGSDETAKVQLADASGASYINLAGLNVTTTINPGTLTKRYYNGRVYGEDADGNIQLRPNSAPVYDSELRKSSTQTPFLDYDGATILSLGTSIQAEGSGSNDSYPELAAEMLGATCINMAWAGTSASYDNTGDHTTISTVKRLSMTQDDVDWGIATWGDVDTNVYSDLYPGINKASKMTMDYRVVAQMAAYSPDVIIIEHNRNDMDRSPGVLENESRAISSVTLGATTVLTLASSGLVVVGDAVRLRVTGISKLDYFVARVQAVSGAQITLNLNSSGFAGSFVSGTCYKVERQYFCEGLGAIISQIYWAATYHGVTTPAIVLTSAPSEYDNDAYDFRVRSNAQYVKDVADYWDVAFFDLNASLAIDENNHRIFLGDGIHPIDLVSRQAIANHLAAFLAGGKLPALRKAQVLLRAQTEDFNDGASVVYDAWNEGFQERDWKVGTISTAFSDTFEAGLGGYTLTGTSPTNPTSPWDAGNKALSCTHDGVSGTSYIQKTGLTLGEYTKVSFKVYLDSTVGLTSAGTTGTLPIMNLRTGSVHHAIQLIIKETAVSMRGYVIPAGASPATVVPRSQTLSDATVHEITYEVIKGNGMTIDGSCILTFDGERISLPLTFDDSTKSTPDRVFLGIISNTGDMPIEVWFDDLTIETGSVVTTTVSDFARTLLDDTSQGAMQATLGLVPGTNVQAYDADLTTIAGLAGTAGFLKKTAANTWALEDKLSSDSTSMSLAGRLNVTRTGMVWGASNDPILFSQGSASGTITGTDVRAAHMLNVNSDNVNAAAVNGNYNLYVGHTVNGAAAQGHKTTIAGVMNVSGTTSNISNKFYTAMAGVAIASANDNGGIGAENGALFGGFLSASLLPGATYWSQICGLEIDMEAQTGLAPKWKTGFQMVQRSTDVEQGTDEDVAVLLANQNGGTAPGWELGFGFGSPHGDWPITATGTLIGTQASVLGGPAYEAAHGIDLRQVAFSGYSFASPGFAVDGLGNMTSNNIVPQPQGRLTLTSGVPSMTANVTAAATVYYAPFKGGFVPLFDGASWKMTSFLASASDAVGLTLALDSDSGHTGYHQSDKNFDLFVFVDAGVVRLGTGPSWSSDTARGTGGGTTELELVDGLHVNKNSMTARFGSASGNTVTVAAQRGLYVGTMRCTANGQTEFNARPAAAGNGAAAIVGLWNAHNKVDLVAVSRDSDATWTDSAGTWGATDGSATNRISFIAGLAEDAVEVTYNQAVTFGTSGNAQIGVNLDSTSATPGNVIYASTINIVMPLALQDDFVPQIGWHYLQAMQRAASGVTATFYGVSAGLQHQRLSARMRY